MQPLIAQQSHTASQRIDLWADERIWGHRVYDDQTPWFVLLEFFGVFCDRHNAGCALTEARAEGRHEDIRYNLPRLGPLRYLVFNNPYLQHIEQTVEGDEYRWRRWLKQVADNPFGTNFEYLRERFGQFSRLARVIELYQNTAVEARSQRRWTSRFLFPYGPDCLYADVDEGNGFGSPDRRFFARGGELLYLMLARSGRGAALAKSIAKNLMDPGGRWNRLIGAMTPPDDGAEGDLVRGIPIGYLPYAERREYDELADDWLGLLGLYLPGNAVLDPLMRITGMHMLLYLLRRSHEELADGAEPRFVLEIAAPRKTGLFDLSSECCSANRMLSRRALQAHIEAVRHSDEWRHALGARDASREAIAVLKREFHWRKADSAAGAATPEKALEALVNAAVTRHDRHAGRVVPDWSRRIGLLSARRGIGTRYSPDDAFLKALVLASVARREEYHRFLARLYDKYGIVIGVEEAERAYGVMPADRSVLAENAERLEQRLSALGLLERLSDDCAYVINPFGAAT